jgi:hypothetical protein
VTAPVPPLVELHRRHFPTPHPERVQCECGWISPHYDVADPRSQWADHMSEVIAADPRVTVLGPTVGFTVQTRWLYSDRDECSCCPGRHAFARGGSVTESDFPTPYEHMDDARGHLHRAIASFGDGTSVGVVLHREGEQ